MGLIDQLIEFARPSKVLRYGVAAMATLGSLGIRIALDPLLGERAPYLPFVLGVIAASRFGGRAPGSFATVLSTLAVDWFFIEPRHSLAVADLDTQAGLALFFVVGVFISLSVGRLREALLSAGPSEQGERPAVSAAVAGRRAGTKFTQKPHYVWLGAAVVLVMLEAGLFFATWTRFTEREQWSVHTRQVLEQIASVFSALTDAESGQRGYLLTGQEAYLTPYRKAVTSAPARLNELRTLTSDNSGQQARIEKLRPLVALKLAELNETVELRRTRGAAAAVAEVTTDRGRLLMDQIRNVLSAMRAEETALLEQSSSRSDRGSRRLGHRHGLRSGTVADRAPGRGAGYRAHHFRAPARARGASRKRGAAGLRDDGLRNRRVVLDAGDQPAPRQWKVAAPVRDWAGSSHYVRNLARRAASGRPRARRRRAEPGDRAAAGARHRIPRGLAGRYPSMAGRSRSGHLRRLRPRDRHGGRQREHHGAEAVGGGATAAEAAVREPGGAHAGDDRPPRRRTSPPLHQRVRSGALRYSQVGDCGKND